MTQQLESRIYYPEDYTPKTDLVLDVWLTEHFSDPDAPVLLEYASRRDCIVPAGDLLNQQMRLDDGRFLRRNWCSPQSKGDTGKYIIRTELPQHLKFYRTIVRFDTANHDHLLLVIVGWSPWERLKRSLDVFGPNAEPALTGDHYICDVNVGVETADEIVIRYESKCPPLEPEDLI